MRCHLGLLGCAIAAGGERITEDGATAWGGAISADGRYVAFSSDAATLVPGDTNGRVDVFLHDRATATTRRVNVGSDGTQALGGHSWANDISNDGGFVAFEPEANNLVFGDTNGSSDVFVRDRGGRW